MSKKKLHRYNDAILFAALREAEAGGEVKRAQEITGAILECHKGFIVSYAAQTRFPTWSFQTYEDYKMDLLSVALEKMKDYDPSRGASFATFIKLHLHDVKWKTHIRGQLLITVGVETARMRAATDQFRNEYFIENGEEPTLRELADYLSIKFRKGSARPVGVLQAKRLVDRPVVERPDGSFGTEDGEEYDGWALIAAATVSVEDQVIESMHSVTLAERVADALLEAVETDLERDLVRKRLMAPPRWLENNEVIHPGPASHTKIALAHGVTAAFVRESEEVLVTRMADLLC